MYQLLLILKQFSQRYNKKFQGSGFLNTVYVSLCLEFMQKQSFLLWTNKLINVDVKAMHEIRCIAFQTADYYGTPFRRGKLAAFFTTTHIFCIWDSWGMLEWQFSWARCPSCHNFRSQSLLLCFVCMLYYDNNFCCINFVYCWYWSSMIVSCQFQRMYCNL